MEKVSTETYKFDQLEPIQIYDVASGQFMSKHGVPNYLKDKVVDWMVDADLRYKIGIGTKEGYRFKYTLYKLYNYYRWYKRYKNRIEKKAIKIETNNMDSGYGQNATEILECLDENSARIVTLKTFHNMSFHEIAEETEQELSDVRLIFNESIKSLRENEN